MLCALGYILANPLQVTYERVAVAEYIIFHDVPFPHVQWECLFVLGVSYDDAEYPATREWFLGTTIEGHEDHVYSYGHVQKQRVEKQMHQDI